jgi:hypothetical protein
VRVVTLQGHSEQRPRLWVCHKCERIGTAKGAADHDRKYGHTSEELPIETSDAVHAEWERQDAERIAGLVAITSLTKRTSA